MCLPEKLCDLLGKIETSEEQELAIEVWHLGSVRREAH